MVDAQVQAFRDSLLAGGECGRLIASRDWGATSLGPLATWPPSLRTATSILLRSPVPLVMLWGEDGVMIYNDAYSVFAAKRHPALLGSKVREGWPEVADFNDNVMKVGLAGGTLAYRDQELTLFRHGRPEQVWMNLDYSPVLGESGRPAGVLAIVVETTQRVAAERRIKQSSERFRAFVTASSTSMYRMSPDWSELRQLDGQGFLSDTQAPSSDWLEAYIHPQDQTKVTAAIQEAIAGKSTFDLEHRVKLADGTVGWTHSRAVPIVDEEGQVVEWFGAANDVTARKRAEDALREGEARFRLMADAVPQIVWITDVDGRVEFFNRQWTNYTGATYQPETAAAVAAGFVHPDDAEATMIAFDEARRIGGVFHVEHRIRSRTGAYRWFLVRGEPYRDPASGEVVRWFGASIDIHDRRAAEERLRQLNETLEAQVAERTAERDRIWQLSPDLMCVAQTDGTFLSVNPAWERLLGWPIDWLTGRNAAEIKHPDDAERTAAELARLAAGGYRTINFEDRYRHRDGSWRWISWMIEPEGEFIYCIGRDVTAEKAAREALAAAEAARREADALYRAYFENTPEALFVIGVEADGGFVIEELNPAHEAGVGFKLADVRGKRIEDVLPPDVAKRVLETYRRVVDTGAVYQYREVFDLDGSPQHWDTSLVPVGDGAGRTTRLIGSSRNVTRQVTAEEALRQAQKMEAVGQLTGGIAHDFNNLLGAVVGSLELIRRKPHDAEKVKRFAEAALEAAERGAKLTGQLLAFSRAQRIELKPVVVADLIDGMRDLLARTLGPMVRLTFSLQGDGAVQSDATQLEMAVLNLAINARDAMPEGGDLTIGTRPHRTGGDGELNAGEYIELSVGDTGSGMPSDVAARAFDPFFTTKGVGKGTGLGLSQVYGIAKQAGGTVRIDSRPGAGTTVRIYLPRTSAPVVANAEAAADEAAQPASSATILVVDDDRDIRRMLVASLLALGYRVVQAEDGPAGLAALEEGSPDLMMVDFAMPGMNGAEVAKVARARRPDLPIVFASGYADTAAIEAVAGGDALVLRKPFRINDLEAVLNVALMAHSPPGSS